ncbi:hypothetical protein JS85_24690 [Vibrio vulnificus]|nr:DUF417 family protein [Vibrio vulnificus]KFK66658.1 hypothetical protein JS85_24690 [Vibrio vulnificus]
MSTLINTHQNRSEFAHSLNQFADQAVRRGFAILGAASATLTFAVTTSFLFTAPIAEASLGGFPAISVVPGQFLLKDIVLLSAALSLLAKALLRDE